MWGIIKQIAPYAVMYTIPLLITTLGGMFSSRSGILNIALEGLMIIGALVAGYIDYLFAAQIGNLYATLLGLLCAMTIGALFSLLHAFASINLNADQTISSTAINMAAAAAALYIARCLTGGSQIITSSMVRTDIPVLSKIPILGPLFFTNTVPTTWIILAVAVISFVVIEKTTFGLRLRACGEYPEAAETDGINVKRMRYIAVMLSGAFSGMGGAVYTLTIAGISNGDVQGLGFLALACLIVGQWKVGGILIASLFFGFAYTLGQVSQLIPTFSNLNPMVFKIFPYFITMVMLIFFSKNSKAPKAEGAFFDYKKR